MPFGISRRSGMGGGLAAVLASNGWADPLRDPFSALARWAADQAERLDFSGVLSIRTPQGPTFYARGVLAGPGSPNIGPETRFNLASAGKMFTALAVAQLVDAGKVGLEDPVGRYVGGLTLEAGAVTLRQLLTHSSGLGNFFSPQNLPAISKARSVSELLPLVASEKPAFPPGSRFDYSNSGFLLLGRVVERASGLSYGDHLRAHVFAPAGMRSSGLEPGPSPVQAVGLTRMPVMRPGAPGAPNGGPALLRVGPGGPPPSGPLRPAQEAALRGNPAGGAYSTAADLQRFFAALTGARLTSKTMLEQLTSPQIVAAPAKDGSPQLDYGLGFGLGVFEGHRWFGHNGGAPGVNVEAVSFPDDQTSVVVMANRDPPVATALFRQVRPFLFDHGARNRL